MDKLLDFDVKGIEKLLNECDELSKEAGWINVVPKKKKKDVDKKSLIYNFRIISKAEPIYNRIEKSSDVEEIIEEIGTKTNILKENMSKVLIHYEEEADENTNIAINAIYKTITNFGKVFHKQLKKVLKEELDTTEELKEEFAKNLIKVLDKRLISNIMSPIYEGMKHSTLDVYDNIVFNINKFLGELGIQTINIEEGTKVDYKYIQPMESDKNITTDYKLDETVKEIHQYPYVFDEEHIASEGRVVLWRLR